MSDAPAGSGSPIREFLSDTSLGARPLELSDGASIYDPGSPAEHLYYIHSGQVRIWQAGPDDSARLMEILGPGDWFGVEALSGAGVASSRAVAVSSTTLSALPIDRLMTLLSQQPAVSAMLIRQLAGKLQAAREDAGRLVFDDCNARLVKTLLHFSSSAAATPQDDGIVMLHITHRQLAQAVGAARETVSLALTQLRQQNLLRTGRNRLLFNPETLRAFAMRVTEEEEQST